MAYEWTQIGYWNKPNLSWTIYLILAISLGFFGIDHLYMRSPFTAVLKFIVNLFTLGFWYFYDIINAFTEADLTKQYGVGTPFVSTGGIGAGMFADEPDKEHAPWKFMGYALTSAFPFGMFGLNNFIAGDTKGALMKAWMTILLCFPLLFFAPLGWLISFLLLCFTLYVLFFNTESLFSMGVPSPLGRGMSTLGPNEPKEVESSGFFYATGLWLMGWLETLPFIGPKIKEINEKVKMGFEAAKVVKASTVDVALAGADAVKTLTVDVPMQATKAVTAIKDGIQNKIEALPSPMEIAHAKVNAVSAKAMGAINSATKKVTVPLEAAQAKVGEVAAKATGAINSATKNITAPLEAAQATADAITNPAGAASKLLTKGLGSRALMKGGAIESNGIAGMALMGLLYGGLVIAIGNFLYIQYKKTKEDKKVLEGYAKVLDAKTGSKHESTLSDEPPMA